MNEMTFTDNDVSSFLKQLVEIGDIYSVDESPDKYIRYTSDNTLVTTNVDGVAKPMALYGTKASDCIIINPFVEGEIDSARNKWFYSTRNITLSGHLAAIMTYLLKIGADSKKKKTEDKPVDLLAIELLAEDIHEIDEKMSSEFKKISNELTNFFNIYWNKSLSQCEVKCSLFITNQRKAYGSSIRVKTWDVLEKLMTRILGTTDMGTFTRKPTTIGIPVFETFTNILVDIYDKINPCLKMIGQPEVNIGTLRSHLKYIGQYAAKAKWCVSPQPSMTPTSPIPAPWMPPVTGTMPYQQPGFMQPMGMPGMMPNYQAPFMPNVQGMMPPQGIMPTIPSPMPNMAMMNGNGMMPQMMQQAPIKRNSDNPFAKP